MRNTFAIVTCVSCLVALVLINAEDASAQMTLKQLQERIRQRQGESIPQDEIQPRQPTAPTARQPTAPAARQPGYLGLMADDANDRGRGVRVTDIRPLGPAATGGVAKGDLITAIDGVRVRQMSDMAGILRVCRAGQTIAIEVLRDGKKHSQKVTLGQRPTAGKPAPAGPEPVPAPSAVPTAAKPPAEGPALVPPNPTAAIKPSPEPPKAQPPTQPEPSVKDLVLRIEELEKRVKQLEKALAERQ